MLRTEEEAKKCWCPFVRAAVHGDDDTGLALGVNRWPLCAKGHMSGTTCIGSACMAWRWAGQGMPGVDASGRAGTSPAHTIGYCGLAGPST